MKRMPGLNVVSGKAAVWRGPSTGVISLVAQIVQCLVTRVMHCETALRTGFLLKTHAKQWAVVINACHIIRGDVLALVENLGSMWHAVAPCCVTLKACSSF